MSQKLINNKNIYCHKSTILINLSNQTSSRSSERRCQSKWTRRWNGGRCVQAVGCYARVTCCL